MKTELFDFHLPESSIAQVPAQQRENSKLLIIDRKTQSIEHKHFSDITEILPRGTNLFRNNASVIKARMRGKRPTGGAVECLLLHPDKQSNDWWCLVKPGKRLQVGATFGHDGFYKAEVISIKESGERLIRFYTENNQTVLDVSEALGEMPLPPYIRREKEDARIEMDKERYQTVYADKQKKVAAAAPTAGLHFTKEIIEQLKRNEAVFHDVTLHVGLGTFKPIQVDTLEEHEMHTEFYEVPASSAKAIQSKEVNNKLCIGTTSLRSIEDFSRNCPDKDLACKNGYCAEADLFIYPPNDFHVNSLLTNFHLPKSTLLCLVSSFLTPKSTDGIAWLKEIYKEAINNNYRFYSYGDAMLIL